MIAKIECFCLEPSSGVLLVEERLLNLSGPEL